MRYIPAAWAAIALAGDDAAVQAASGCQVLLGGRAEVDTALLETVNPMWASAVRAMAERVGTGHLWAAPVTCAVQRSGGAGKKDLTEEFDALRANPLTAALCECVLAPQVAQEELELLCTALGASVVHSADELRVSIDLDPRNLDTCLGGPAWPGEESRRVTLTIKHAAWRDRQVRRLSRVECSSMIRA